MRLTYVSFEGEGPAVDAAVRALVERLMPAPVTVVDAPVAALPAAEGVHRRDAEDAETAQREPARRAGRPRAARRAKEEQPAREEAQEEQGGQSRPGGRPSPVTDLIMRALASGQKSLRQVVEFIQKNGQPEYTPKQASATLAYLRNKRGKLDYDEATGLWRLSE
jgi:hypothetical protein